MKKFSLLLLTFLLLSFTGCSTPSLSGKKVKKEYFTGGQIRTEFIMDDDTEQNGLLKKYGYNGNVTSTVTIHNGVKDGIETWYDQRHRPVRRVPYVNGRIHGTFTDLYENGETLATIEFVKGIRNGMARSFSKDGSVYRQVMYRNGKIVN
jgi:antitoxin component YwqK of YwqJK toxin-antitoxin module